MNGGYMKGMPLADRLWARVDKTQVGTGCWHWMGVTNGWGYGVISNGARRAMVHRVSFELLRGVVPIGLHLDHLCRDRSCVNPAHLEPVTPKENTLRGLSPSAIRSHLHHCGRGHEYTSENTYRSPDGSRICRACNRIWGAKTDAKRRPRHVV